VPRGTGQPAALAPAPGPAGPGGHGDPDDPDDLPLGGLPLPSMAAAHRTRISTHIWPPKAARGDFARAQAEVWDQLARKPEVEVKWLLWLIFPRCILAAGRGPRQGDAYALARSVRARLQHWQAREYSQLWAEAVESTLPPGPAAGRRRRAPPPPEKTQEERNVERATTLAQQGQPGRGLQALSSAGMAEADRDTVSEMKKKHPAAAGPVTFRPDPAAAVPQLTFTAAKVLKAALSFRRGSAPGPTGLRPEHLRVVLKGLSPALAERALTALTKLTALLLHPLVLLIEAEVPDLNLNAWFYDDGVQAGTLEELKQVVDILVREGPARGLFLSTAATVRAPDQPKSCPGRAVEYLCNHRRVFLPQYDMHI
jgi:hypothetical protein